MRKIKNVTRQVTLKRTKIGGKCHNLKIQIRQFNGQKFIKNAKNGQFWRVKQCYQQLTLIRLKLVENAKIQMRHF